MFHLWLGLYFNFADRQWDLHKYTSFINKTLKYFLLLSKIDIDNSLQSMSKWRVAKEEILLSFVSYYFDQSSAISR
jgi:hypothetical protein